MAEDKQTKQMLDAALAVRRGERRLSDLPPGAQADIRKFLRTTPESRLREHADASAAPLFPKFGRMPRVRLRRARSA